MITNSAIDEEQERQTSSGEAGTSSSNQISIPLNNNSVVKVPSSSSSDDNWSTSDSDELAGKQVAVIRTQAPTDNLNKIVNTYTDCTNVSSSVQNTTIYKDGVTVNHNVYCCPASLDYLLKWKLSKRRIIIIIVSLLGLLVITLFGFWFSSLNKSEQPHDIETDTTQIPTTEKLSNNTIFTTSSISTDSTTSIAISTSTDSSIASTTETVNNEWKIINREEWGAALPNYMTGILDYPPAYVIFSETRTETCNTTLKCKEIVRKIQALHLTGGYRADIKYNFLVGGDGLVYEGRGWDVHSDLADYDTEYFDHLSISVSFIGKFKVNVPTESIIKSAKTLLEYAVKTKKLTEDYKLLCLRQLSHTIQNPGDKLYDIIKMWDRWDSRTIEDFPPAGSYYID